ncbi:MAG: hypothetical protein WCS20_14245 [Alphaproteobacteria bacterium]|jgi:aspartate-semialdehyde dehydrogenase
MDPINWQEATDILREAPGILVMDKREAGGYITPIGVVAQLCLPGTHIVNRCG